MISSIRLHGRVRERLKQHRIHRSCVSDAEAADGDHRMGTEKEAVEKEIKQVNQQSEQPQYCYVQQHEQFHVKY